MNIKGKSICVTHAVVFILINSFFFTLFPGALDRATNAVQCTYINTHACWAELSVLKRDRSQNEKAKRQEK